MRDKFLRNYASDSESSSGGGDTGVSGEEVTRNTLALAVFTNQDLLQQITSFIPNPPLPAPPPRTWARRSPRIEITHGERVGYRFLRARGRDLIIPLYCPSTPRPHRFDVFAGRYYSGHTGG